MRKKVCRFCGKEFTGPKAMMDRLAHLGDNKGACMNELMTENFNAQLSKQLKDKGLE
jgi:hypothetical protein